MSRESGQSDSVHIAEMLDAGGARGPNIKLYKDGEPERTQLVWNKEERIVAVNDNEPLWAIEAAKEDGWTVVYSHPRYNPPERIADYVDADTPPHRRLQPDKPLLTEVDS